MNIYQVATGSNITMTQTELNTIYLVDATSNITLTVADMEPGDSVPVISDSNSSGTIAVKNPSAATLVTLSAGQATKIMVDTTGVYFYEVKTGIDPTAIHDDISGEIKLVPLKASPEGNDRILVEDSASSDAKAGITISSIPISLLTGYVDWTSASANFSTTGSATADDLITTGKRTILYTAVTSNTTLAEHHLLDCTANTFTVTLPTAVGITGREYIVKNSGAGAVTVVGHTP